MKTAFDVPRNKWTGETIDRLPGHDLVFGSPVNSPTGGLPLGDGDTGSLLWLGEDTLHLHVNKCDLWDDSTLSDDTLLSTEEENLTCLRHGGEIGVRFHTPCFDVFYQNSFEARLSLADAAATVQSETPFGKMNIRCFADAGTHTAVLSYWGAFTQPESPEIVLSRFGSRNFWRWYGQLKHVPEAGLAGTRSYAHGNRLYVTQQLNGTAFCLCLAVVTRSEYQTQTVNRHVCSLRLSAANRHEFDIYYTIALGDTPETAMKNGDTALSLAVKCGVQAMYARHVAEWAEFWNRSYIHIPDDYIENIFYLSLYYANSECRGAYPPHFTQGLWGFRHDFLPWTYYFFYNMQHMYGPLNASGHSELAENYYRMRFNGLNAARRYAERYKKCNGAFYHDVTDRYGRAAELSDYDGCNCSPASQLALAMWRYYRYTGNEDFLKDVALPVLNGAAQLYESLLQRGEDGCYHLDGTTAYEANPVTRDTITDMAMIRALFSVMCRLTEGERRARYEELLSHLPEYPVTDLNCPDDWNGEVFTYGLGAGKKPQADGKILAMGYDSKGVPVRKSYGNPDCKKGGEGFPDVELAPIYPAGLVGVGRRNTPLYKLLHDQLMLHSHPKHCMHWCMMPLYLARMGMSEQLSDYIHASLSTWQVYPNGMNADGPAGVAHAKMRTATVTPLEVGASTGERISLRASPFRYFDFESTPIAAHATVEALLQSHDGVLRICPAMRERDKVSFRLFAEGGFVVQAEISAESCLVTIDSLRGEVCLLCPPAHVKTETLHVYRMRNNTAVPVPPEWVNRDSERLLELSGVLGRGERVLLCSEPVDRLQTETPLQKTKNPHMKQCGDAVLGSPSLFGAKC